MTGSRCGMGWLIAMVGALLLGALADWAQPLTPGGTLRIAVEADVPGLDPHRASSTAALRVLGNLFNSLLTFDAEWKAVPDLAASWEIREHGKVYVFHLHKGVKFHSAFNLRKAAFRDVRVRRALLGYGLDRQAIARMALLGLAQPLWSFVPPASWAHLDIGEQFPYAAEQAMALLTEVGYDAKHPLRYTLMIPGVEPLLATVTAIMKSQYAQLGVEVTVELLDRSIFLRRLTRDHNWDQLLQLSGAAFDVEDASRVLDTHAGSITPNQRDSQVNALIDHLRKAGTEEAYL